MKRNQPHNRFFKGFSLAEALITLLVVAIITLATIPVITKKHRDKTNVKHGMYACYWNGNNLVAKQVVDGEKTSGTTQYDSQEGRYGCVFNPPPGAKNFVVTIVGAGGGGAGAGAVAETEAFTETTSFTRNLKRPGVYKFLIAGAGGSGGSSWQKKGDCANAREWPCSTTGSPGAVFVSGLLALPEGAVITGNVGAGGSPITEYNNMSGRDGGNTTLNIKLKSNSTFFDYSVITQGGSGGATVNYTPDPNHVYGRASRSATMPGYTVNGYRSLESVHYSYNHMENNIPYMRSYTNAAAGSPGGYAYKKMPLATAKVESKPQWYEHEKTGAYTLNSNWGKVTYSIKGNNLIYAGRGTFNALRPYRNGLMTKSLMDEFGISQYENQESPFASGASGEVDDGAWKYFSGVLRRGGNGVVAYKKKDIYAGTGGKAGKSIQIPYSEMPSKTLLFPGKGGRGGTAATNIYYTTQPFDCGWQYCSSSYYTNNASTEGKEGQSSYIKNGSEIGGGAGAYRIVPDVIETFSKVVSSDNNPIGGNGELSNILTNKKSGSGGLGGLNKGEIVNNSLHGLTQTVFRNNSDISSFKYIYGAGAGGGGGTAQINGTSLSFGNGGNGSSGLVFIQW